MSDLAAQINDPFADCKVISVYTRAQAIEDGMLVDVSIYAKGLGFRFPVAVTKPVWDSYISWDNAQERAYQDETGRLFDVLWVAMIKAQHTKGSHSTFDIACIPRGKMETKTVSLKFDCGPGDQGEPVITVMLPWED
jgi:hypothetical protein